MTFDTQSTSVSVEAFIGAPIDRAFEVFTIGIGTWWDADKHILRAPLARMEFQPWVGGRIIDHGRRNMALISAGIAPIITPVTSGEGPSGFAIFTTDPDATRTILDGDPGVTAGIFTYEVFPVRGFPGSTLPTT